MRSIISLKSSRDVVSKDSLTEDSKEAAKTSQNGDESMKRMKRRHLGAASSRLGAAAHIPLSICIK
jgi:hypothetical protein